MYYLLAETVRELGTLSVIRDILVSCAAIASPLIAYSALQTWRRTLMGNAEHSTAKTLLVGVYGLREEIRTFRAGTMSGAETVTAAEELGIDLASIPEKERPTRAFLLAMDRRFKKVGDARIAFNVAEREAEALWTIEEMKVLRPLDELCAKLVFAFKRYARIRDDEIYNASILDVRASKLAIRPTNPKEREEVEAIIFDRSESVDRPDRFMTDLNNCIEEINKVVRPKLKQEPRGLIERLRRKKAQ